MGAKEHKANIERMKELIARLKEADIAYYRDDRPILSDRDYDALTEELRVSNSIRAWLFPVHRRRPCPVRFWRS